MASFRLFILKIIFDCFRESIFSEKEDILNEEVEVRNPILDEANEKLWSTLQNKDLTALSGAQVSIVTAHKKIKKC